MTGLVVQFVTIVMLALVGGVVLWMHYRFDALHNGASKLPMLSKQMNKSLVSARVALQELKKEVGDVQPKITRDLNRAHRSIQDLEYLTEKAEKVLEQLDQKVSQAQRVLRPIGGIPPLPQNADAKVVIEKADEYDERQLEIPMTLESEESQISENMITSKAEQELLKKLERQLSGK